MTSKYFMVIDTTKSDLIEQKPLTQKEIEYQVQAVKYNIFQIDKMLHEIEFLKLQNSYMVHALEKNNQAIGLE